MDKAQIQKIIRLWFDRIIGDHDRDAILKWLVSSNQAEDKQQVLYELWNHMEVPYDDVATQKALSRFRNRRDEYERQYNLSSS